MLTRVRARWRRLTGRQKKQVVLALLVVALCVVAGFIFMANSDGISVVDAPSPELSYLGVFTLVALDAVIPIFPGETTLNTASTAAAHGTLDLLPIIVMGALGAIVGDSTLFWLARRSSRRIEPQLTRATSNSRVREALEMMDASAPVLIVGGRYVPGMRFVVNASMGLSTMAYPRFLGWSVLSGTLWSVYTCLLAYTIGLSLGDFPLASVVISGLVTTVAVAIVLLALRRQHHRHPEVAPQDDGR